MPNEAFSRELFDYWHTRLLIQPVETVDGRRTSAVECRRLDGRPVFRPVSRNADLDWWLDGPARPGQRVETVAVR